MPERKGDNAILYLGMKYDIDGNLEHKKPYLL